MILKESYNFIKSIFSISTTVLRKNKQIFFPFVIIAFFQFLALEIIFLSPKKPLSYVFGPPISRIWSAMYLHYPFNFLLMPKLFYYADLLISVFIGGFLTAVAILMIQSVNQDKAPHFKIAFKNSLSRYITVFLITLVIFFLLFYVIKFQKILIGRFLAKKTTGILGFIRNFWVGGFGYINFLVAIFIQALFAFCIPAVMIEKRPFLGSLRRNFSLLKSLFLNTFLLILLPSLLYLPIIILKNNLSVLIDKSSPEITLVVIGAGILFAIVLDAFITTVITTLFLLKKDTEA